MANNRIGALLYDKSYARLEKRLAEMAAPVQVVTWSAANGLQVTGDQTDPAEVDVQIGWISADLFADGAMDGYLEALEACANPRWVQTAHAGLDHPCYARLSAREIRITKSGAQSIPITEYVLAYVLNEFQGIAEREALQAEQRWQPQRFRELWQSRWLIIGYGHIGRGVAKRAKAFDCHTTVLRQNVQADEFADRVDTLAKVHDYLPDADVVVLACPATEQTIGLVDQRFVQSMREGSILINIARGSLIDDEALLEGLASDRPARAVLDVFKAEPLPAEDPYWQHPKVTITAHTSNAGMGTPLRGDQLFLDNLEAFIGNRPLFDEVKRG